VCVDGTLKDRGSTQIAMTAPRTVSSNSQRIARGLEYAVEYILHRQSPGSAPPFSPDLVRRILVLHHYEIGDVLCITPSLRALRRAFPQAHLAILVAENCRAVVERNPDVDQIFSYRRAKYQSGWLDRLAYRDLLRVIRDLRSQRFDLAISMRRPHSNTNAWLAYVSGATWRLGYLTSASYPVRFFLNLWRSPNPKVLHEVDGGLELLASIGVPAAGRELTLVPDPEVQARMRERLCEAGFEGGRLAFIHISSRREPNRWPVSAFAQAADGLNEKFGFSILLSWAPGDVKNPLFPGDDGKAEDVAARMQARPIMLRTPALAELIAAMSLSDFVLSPDGGCVHIAAALGLPQVALFGKASLEQWRPVNPKSIVLHGGGRADRITVDEALAAAEHVLARWGRDSATRSTASKTAEASGADAVRRRQPSPGAAATANAGDDHAP
jgi:ADP-heptose:LPS heptosyltransferase